MKRLPFLVKRDSFSNYHAIAAPSKNSLDALKGVRPVSSTSIGNWRQHLPRVAGQIQQHGSITKDLIEYGYEQDESWDKILTEVKPNLEPSHWPEFFPEGFLKKAQKNMYGKAIQTVIGHIELVLLMKRAQK